MLVPRTVWPFVGDPILSRAVLLGRAMVALGQVEEGAQLLHEGFAMWTSDGSQTGVTEYAALAADVLIDAGRLAEAERFVRAGEQALADLHERFFAAELARLRSTAKISWLNKELAPPAGAPAAPAAMPAALDPAAQADAAQKAALDRGVMGLK